MEFDRIIEKYVNAKFEDIPPKERDQCEKVPKKWYQRVQAFAVKRQMRYEETSLKYLGLDKDLYYKELIKYSRRNYMIFPYHLSDIFIRGMGITPFTYYIKMISYLMLNGKSYDTIPNFTAADEYRVLGIARNEFIDTLNEYRRRGFQLRRKAVLRQLLPQTPADDTFEDWWIVKGGWRAEQQDGRLSTAERDVLASFSSTNVVRCGSLPKDVLLQLYKKEKIYIEIPVEQDDTFEVSPLTSFVMNRTQGEYFERLLYNLFFCLNGRTPLSVLSGGMWERGDDVRTAAALLQRLHYTTRVHTQEEETKEAKEEKAPVLRVGVVVDETITAYLMMATLSKVLTSYAVMLYEVGKITNEKLDDFCDELDKCPRAGLSAVGDIVAALAALRLLLETLRAVDGKGDGIDILREERVCALDEKTLHQVVASNYRLLISIVPLSNPLICPGVHMFGYCCEEQNTIWATFYCSYLANQKAMMLPRGKVLNKIPKLFNGISHVVIKAWDNKMYIVKTGNLIPFAERLLVSSPILILPFCCEKDSPEFVDVPLPDVSEPQTFLKDEHTLDDDQYATSSSMAQHPLVRYLLSRLRLQKSCGYVRMLRLRGNPHLISSTEIKTEWTVFEIAEGVPLFSSDMVSSMCERIKQYMLFTDEAVLKEHQNSQLLSAQDLRKFIAQCNNLVESNEHNGSATEPSESKENLKKSKFSSAVPFPTSKVQVADGQLHVSHDELLFTSDDSENPFGVTSVLSLQQANANAQLKPQEKVNDARSARKTMLAISRQSNVMRTSADRSKTMVLDTPVSALSHSTSASDMQNANSVAQSLSSGQLDVSTSGVINPPQHDNGMLSNASASALQNISINPSDEPADLQIAREMEKLLAGMAKKDTKILPNEGKE